MQKTLTRIRQFEFPPKSKTAQSLSKHEVAAMCWGMKSSIVSSHLPLPRGTPNWKYNPGAAGLPDLHRTGYQPSFQTFPVVAVFVVFVILEKCFHLQGNKTTEEHIEKALTEIIAFVSNPNRYFLLKLENCLMEIVSIFSVEPADIVKR